MKSAIGLLLVLLLCITASGCRKSGNASADPTQVATEFVTMLSEGNFRGAAGMFDPAFRESVSVEQLRDSWKGWEQQVGAFKKLDGASLVKNTESEQNSKIVSVSCSFTKAVMNITVFFNDSNQIIRWQMMPKPEGQ